MAFCDGSIGVSRGLCLPMLALRASGDNHCPAYACTPESMGRDWTPQKLGAQEDVLSHDTVPAPRLALHTFSSHV